MVVGGELEVMGATLEYVALPGSSVGPLYSAKLRFGADLGQSLIYAVGGYGAGQVSNGTDTFTTNGFVAGAGFEYLIRDNISVGVEYLYHSGDVQNTSVSYTHQTVNAWVNYRF
ncbi:outer membrane protein [Halovulum sp. GXIMD14793]